MISYSLSAAKEKTKGRNRYNTTYPYILPTYIHKKTPLPPLPPPLKKKKGYAELADRSTQRSQKRQGDSTLLQSVGITKSLECLHFCMLQYRAEGEGIKKTPRVLLAFCRHTNLRQIPCSYRLEMYVECICLSLPILQTACTHSTFILTITCTVSLYLLHFQLLPIINRVCGQSANPFLPPLRPD